MEQVSFLMEPRAAEYSSSGDSLEAIVLKTRHELISRPALHPPVRLPFYNGIASLQHAIMMNSFPSVIGAYAVFGGLGEPDHDGNTPLHYASLHDNVEVISFLLNAGSEIDRRNKNGQTPLMWASSSGHMIALRYLLAKGANINAADHLQNSVLINAVQGGHLWISHFLIENDADPKALDGAEHNCLHWAAYKGHLRICEYLQDKGIYDIDATDRQKRTALHWAAKQNHPQVCKFLLEHGVNKHLTDEEGLTAAHVAKANNNIELHDYINQFQGTNDSGSSLIPAFSRLNFVAFLSPALFFMASSILPGIIFVIFIALYSVGMQVFCRREVALQQSNSIHGKLMSSGGSQMMDGHAFVAFWAGSVFAFVWMFVALIAPAGVLELPWTTYTLGTFMFSTLYFWYQTLSAGSGHLKKAESSENPLLALAAKGIIPDDKFCHTCMIEKPKRSKHCSICNVCVSRFDHHCIWINSDVGQDNHLYFVLFLWAHLSTGVLWCIMGYHSMQKSILDEYSPDENFRNVVIQNPVAFWSCVYIGIISVWLGYLFLYHLKLAAINFTTNEDINKNRYFMSNEAGKIINPYDKGIRGNLVEFFCYGRKSLIQTPRTDPSKRFYVSGPHNTTESRP